MYNDLAFAFSITGPVLVLVILGCAVRKIGLINSNFVTSANALVFNVSMPIMLFLALANSTLSESLDIPLALIGVAGTLLLILLLIVVGRCIPKDQRGVFIQGSYRGNLAVLGIALAVATYGDSILGKLGMYIAVVTTAYNVVAVWLLKGNGFLKQIVSNPILIGIVTGMFASLIQLPIPDIINNTGSYLSGLTLPLALMCIGASLEFSSLKKHGKTIALASLFKLVVSPLLLLSLGLLFSLEGVQLAVLFFMAASPTATASYIMARQMTQHGALAAEIVAVTTTLGVLTYTIGIALLRNIGIV